MFTSHEINSQRILYDPSLFPIDSTPILLCPADVLTLIGRLLPRQDAISFTSVCIQLFNLRFIGSGAGIISEQCWKRVPGLTETLSSIIILPNGREITERRVIKHAVPAITTLCLDFEEPLTEQETNSVAVRLKQLVKLNSLEMDCTALPVSAINIILTAVLKNSRVQGAQSPFFDLALNDLSADIFEQIDLLRYVRSLKISGHWTSLPVELGQLSNLQNLDIFGWKLTSLPAELGRLERLQSLGIRGYELTSLPAELGQLSNLQHLRISGYQLTSLPAELGRLERLQRLDINGDNLTSLPAELGQLERLQSLDIFGWKLTSLPAELGQLSNLQNLMIRGYHLTFLPIELGQLERLQSLSIMAKNITSLPVELDRLGYSLESFIFNEERRVRGKVV